MMQEIRGSIDPRFSKVQDVFARNFEKNGETGASCCVYIEGEKVVDIWAGHRDRLKTRPWEENTRCVIFSATKGIAATALLMLIDRNLLDPEQTVAHYWPEFAENGKEAITVAQLFNHRSGLSAMQEKVAVELFADIDAAKSFLARQAPLWPAGEHQGYCATTMGAYAGALVHQLTGKTIGHFIEQEIAGPLKAEFNLGLPAELNDLVAELIPVSNLDRILKTLPGIITGRTTEGRISRGVLNKNSATHKALLNPDMGKEPVARFNDPDIRAMELPWGSGVSNARGLATIYAALANGGELNGTRLVNPDTINQITPRLSWYNDKVLHKELGFSLGFLKEEPHIFSPNSEAFGHSGIGGSLGLADPVTHMSFGYVMNKMDHHLRPPKLIRLCHAVYDSL